MGHQADSRSQPGPEAMPKLPCSTSTSGSAVEELSGLKQRVPLTEEEAKRAELLIKRCTLEELTHLGLAPPARPTTAKALAAAPLPQRLQAVQAVIQSLEYNHTGGYYYNVNKERSVARIMATARDVLKDCLPIKCIEAVFLGLYLTSGWEGLDRIPLAFKSRAAGVSYRHIVLAVYDRAGHKFGALGMSRRRELMDKPLVYDSLAALVADYKASYEMWWHELVSVYVGLPVEHDVESQGQVYWRALKLKLGKNTWQKAEEALNQHAGAMRKMHSQLRAGILPAADLPSGPGKAERKPAVSSKTHTPSKPQQAAGSALGGAATGITTASSSATYGTAAATPSLQHEASNSSGPADDRAPTTASMMQGRADGDSDGAKGSKGSDSASTSEDEGDGNADGDGHGINIARAKDRPAG